jgi:23S rRNA (uracil1939-C5)-methyltransferase
MLPYHKQLEYKTQQVQDQLKRLGNIPLPEMLPIIGADDLFTNGLPAINLSSLLPINVTSRGTTGDENVISEMPSVGFPCKGNFDKVVDIVPCHLMAPPANLIRETLRETALELEMPFYDIRQHTGWMRNVVIRNCTTGEIMVNVVLGYEDKKNT